MQKIYNFFVLLIVAVFSSETMAGVVNEIKNCSQITDFVSRLACYDRISAVILDSKNIEGKQIKGCIDDIKLGSNDHIHD